MKLENQVCSLELAKKLKELGVPQTGLYFHVQQEGQNPTIVPKARAKRILSWHKEIVSAFTVAELGEMLDPQYYTMRSMPSGSWTVCDVFSNEAVDEVSNIPFDTEADARAKMLIYLLENKLINTSPTS